MIRFAYDPAVLERFPSIRAGVIHATGLANGPSSAALLAEYEREQAITAERLGATPLSELPSLAAWRRAFSTFGVKPTQYRSAAEALLRRLTKKGDIPTINALVDIGNLVSIRYALPVAVFDQRGVSGTTSVRFADGTEQFTDLGADAMVHPQPGEVVFADAAGLVSARRWCWRQSAQSAAGADTIEALITVEAHHEPSEGDIRGALEDLQVLLGRHQPAVTMTAAMLTPATPQFAD